MSITTEKVEKVMDKLFVNDALNRESATLTIDAMVAMSESRLLMALLENLQEDSSERLDKLSHTSCAAGMAIGYAIGLLENNQGDNNNS